MLLEICICMKIVNQLLLLLTLILKIDIHLFKDIYEYNIEIYYKTI